MMRFELAHKQEALSSSWITIGLLNEALSKLHRASDGLGWWRDACEQSRWIVPADCLHVLLRNWQGGYELVARWRRDVGFDPPGERATAASCRWSAALKQMRTSPWMALCGGAPSGVELCGRADAAQGKGFMVPLTDGPTTVGAMVFCFHHFPSDAARPQIEALANIYGLHVSTAFSNVRARTALAAANARLASEVSERVRYLSMIQRSEREIDELSDAASHDLREPLSVVSGHLRQLASGCAPESPDAAAHVRSATDGASRMRALLDGLVEWSRVGRGDEEPEDVSLAAVVEEVCAAMQPTLEPSAGVVTSGALPVVRGHRDLLAALFRHLLSNCVKFRSESPLAIHIAARHEESDCILSIRDNGIGIPADQLGEIFRIFRRLQATDERGGCGMGLAICRRIADEHGGRIWAESAVGKGTTIHVAFPHRPMDERASRASMAHLDAPF